MASYIGRRELLATLGGAAFHIVLAALALLTREDVVTAIG